MYLNIFKSTNQNFLTYKKKVYSKVKVFNSYNPDNITESCLNFEKLNFDKVHLAKSLKVTKSNSSTKKFKVSTTTCLPSLKIKGKNQTVTFSNKNESNTSVYNLSNSQCLTNRSSSNYKFSKLDETNQYEEDINNNYNNDNNITYINKEDEDEETKIKSTKTLMIRRDSFSNKNLNLPIYKISKNEKTSKFKTKISSSNSII